MYHFVAHLITMVDTWVNDECDDNEMYGTSSSAEISVGTGGSSSASSMFEKNNFKCSKLLYLYSDAMSSHS